MRRNVAGSVLVGVALLFAAGCADGQTAVVDTTTDVSGPTRVGLSAGGGAVQSPRFKLQVVAGAPVSAVHTQGQRFRLSVAPGAVAR